MKKNKLFTMLNLGIISFCAYTAPTLAATTGAATKVMQQVSSSASTVSTDFIITANAPLTETLLDNCWNNRENLAKQKIIADYLMTKPRVPNDFAIAWKTARLIYFIGNFGAGKERFVDTSEGVKLFDYGVEAGKIAKKLKPDAVEGHYWYAIDLGSYGLAKGIIAAASGAKDGIEALKKGRAIDPGYQWYGGSRVLGRYYQELPGLLGGNKKWAEDLLVEAVKRAPQFKDNWVFLGQFYLAQKEYKKAETICSKAIGLAALDGKYEDIRHTEEAQACAKTASDKLK